MHGQQTYLPSPGCRRVCSQASAVRQSSWYSFRLILFDLTRMLFWVYSFIISQSARFVNVLRMFDRYCHELFTTIYLSEMFVTFP